MKNLFLSIYHDIMFITACLINYQFSDVFERNVASALWS